MSPRKHRPPPKPKLPNFDKAWREKIREMHRDVPKKEEVKK